ncbi:MAG: Ig-like domain-containing protein [Gemmatimonadaceae bacterium]
MRWLVSLTILLGCAGPTDLSPSVWVTIQSPSPVLLRGTQTQVRARVWRPGTAGDSIEMHNVMLLWSSENPQIATVESGAQGRGRVTGVNSGFVEIRAITPGYEDASPAVLQLRIANPLEIDSISPDTVRYGDRVTLHGIGVGDLFFVGLGSGFLISDSLSIGGDRKGLSRQSFWVPWPAQSGNIFAAGSGQLVAAGDTTIVLPWDRYEPNEAVPTDVELDGPDPFPTIPFVRFFNPALAFEDLRDFPIGLDAYRLRAASRDAPYTIVFASAALAGAYATYLTDRLRPANSSDSTEWRVGSGEHTCKGFHFRPSQAVSDSVIIALRRLPASSMDLASFYLQEGRYLLAIVQGYHTADPRLAPDPFEENDICNFADENFVRTATRVDLGVKPLAENLTIDNAHDIDWIRFRVPGSLPQAVAIRTAAQPFGPVDRSDIDVYVLTVPSLSQGLTLAAADSARGSTISINPLLVPGDYYLAVVDSAGVPTRYSLCMALGTSCTLPATPASAFVASKEANLLGPLQPYLVTPRVTEPAPPRRR